LEKTNLERASLLTTGLCALIAVFEGLELQASGVAAPRLGPAFHLSPEQLSWFFSISTFGMMFGTSVGGRLSDIFGRKAVLIGSIGVFGVMSILNGLAQSYELLIVARFFTGIGMGGALPNMVALASENAAPGRKNTAVGLLCAGLPGGAAIASLIAVFGAPSDWRTVFFLGGIAPLIVIPLLILVLPESHQQNASRAAHADTSVDRRIGNALFGEGRARRTMLLWVYFYFFLVALYVLLNWLPSLLVAKGLSRTDASLAQLSFNILGALASLATGWLMDRLALPRMVLLSFAAAVLALWLVARMPPDFGTALAVAGFAGVCVTAISAMLYSVAPINYPTEIRGTGVGVAFTVGRFGSASGPLFVGVLLGAGRSPQEVLTVIVPVLFVAGAAAFLLSLLMRRSAKMA
jgi:AAHS family 3-hydroxyphenylpropionic acid transporter